MDLEGRATDVQDRLETVRLASDVTVFDCYSKDVREPFRMCTAALADALYSAYESMPQSAGLPVSAKQLSGPVAAVKEAASTQRSAQLERLDKALIQLAHTVAGDSGGTNRVEALETLVAQLEALRLLKHSLAESAKASAPAQQPPKPAAPKPSGPLDAQGAAVTSDCLRSMGSLLGVPPNVLTPAPGTQGGAAALCAEVAKRAQALVQQVPQDFFQPLVSQGSLDASQVEDLKEVAEALRAEYTVRRRMLLERLKVTLQSFMWSPKLKEMDDAQRKEVESVVDQGLSRLQPTPSVNADDVYGVTGGDVAAVVAQRTVSAGTMGALNASVKGVLIGKVPDRGGRAEGRAKEANMPDWKARGSGGGGQGRGGGRGGGGGGGSGRQSRPQSAQPAYAPSNVGLSGQGLAMGYGGAQQPAYAGYGYGYAPYQQQYYQQQAQQQQLAAQHAAMAAMGYVPQGTVRPQSGGGGRVQGGWQGGGRGGGVWGGRGGGRGGGWGGSKRGRS